MFSFLTSMSDGDFFRSMLLLLLAGHFVSEFAGAREYLAAMKRVSNQTHAWYYTVAHGVVHGSIVLLLTGDPSLGYVETFSHTILDRWNTRGWISEFTTRTANIILKILYVIYLMHLRHLSSR